MKTLEKLKEGKKRMEKFKSFINLAKKNSWDITSSESFSNFSIFKTFNDGTELELSSSETYPDEEIRLDLYDKKRFLSSFRPRAIDRIPIKMKNYYKIIKSMEEIIKKSGKIHELALEKFGLARARAKLKKVI